MVQTRFLSSLFYLGSLLGSFFFVPTDFAFAQGRLPRILQGVETSDYPAVGIVGSVSSGGFCSGTLISSTHVLTAAHCATFIEGPTRGTFQLGDQIYQTENIFVHPDFNSFTFENDIAILQLNEPVLDVQPSEIFREIPLVGDLLFIVGYGGTGTADGGNDGSFGTKRVGMTTIDEVTSTMVSWTFDDPSESNTAEGDSGGPGYLDIDGDLFVASVTSGGTEPDSVLGDFAFNTRVDAFADWIDMTIDSSDQPPVVDDPQPDTPGDESACEAFWAQPFPFLQLLIDFLTALLEALNQAIAPPADGGTPPPTETPTTPPTDTPPTDTPTTPPTDIPTTPPTDTPTTPPTDIPATPPTDIPTTPTQPTVPGVGEPGVGTLSFQPLSLRPVSQRGNRTRQPPTSRVRRLLPR